MTAKYVSCPTCQSAVLTKEYREAFGQCWTCYEREQFTIGERIQRALR